MTAIPAAGSAARATHAAVDGLRATVLLGRRELRTGLRMPEVYVPNLLVPVLWFFVIVGSLDTIATRGGIAGWEAFQLPVAIVFATMSGSVGLNMVTDIERGYFDKLLLTPVSRLAILVGGMGGDLARITAQGATVVTIALVAGVDLATGLPGAAALVALGGLWGLAFSAAGFAVALRTGSAQATQSMWFLFVPVLFLTTTFAPLDAMSGWLRAVAVVNPVTYVLDGMRALTLTGWDTDRLAVAVGVSAGLGAVTVAAALWALRTRLR